MTTTEQAFSLSDQVQSFRARFGLSDVYSKRVDNRGEGDESLYGVRNFRVVLHGIYYRGGANNRYHRQRARDNRNPLPDDGLQNLCESGFTGATYFYARNFTTAPPSVNCDVQAGSTATPSALIYEQRTATDPRNHRPMLENIYARIRGQIRGPLYGHCWNGWHASGLIASLTLRQFCGWSGDEALRYWTANTDGHDRGYQSIKEMIRDFTPIPELSITPDERALICP